MKPLSSLKLAVLSWFALSVSFAGVATGEDEPYYQPGFPQFVCDKAPDDPRVLTIMRNGAGRERTAEMSVFELVDKGNRLRKIHATPLRNHALPLWWVNVGQGRFLVTVDERDSSGTSDNCLVMYDFTRKTVVAKRLEDFMSAEERATLKQDRVIHGVRWMSGDAWIDNQNLMFYPTSLKDCRDDNLPFVVIDLRSQTVATRPVPASLPAASHSTTGWTNGGKIIWDWSMGDKPDPDMKSKLAYPKYLEAELLPDDANKEFRDFLDFDQSACYELDTATGDYVRCAAEKWIPRPKRESPKSVRFGSGWAE